MAGRTRALVATAVAAVSFTAFAASSTVDGSTHEMSGAATATERAVRGERLSVAPPPPAAPPSDLADPLLRTVFELTNAERARAGLPPLRYHALLGQAAQVHSEDQARRNTLTHDGPNGESPGDRISATGYRFRTWAENAAMGYRTAEHVMSGWMNSSGHRANILRSSVTEIGLGLAYSAGGVPYWTQVFAAPRD